MTSQAAAEDTRQQRIIKRNLVAGLVPPEQGGVLNIPIEMKANPNAVQDVHRLIDMLQHKRAEQRLPPLHSYWINRDGSFEEVK